MALISALPLTYKIIIGFVITAIIYFSIIGILKRFGKNPDYLLPVAFFNRVKIPLALLMLTIFLNYVYKSASIEDGYTQLLSALLKIGYVISITWLVISGMRAVVRRLVAKQDLTASDNLRARKVFTQLKILERVVSFIIILLAAGILLMSFENIRQIGVSVLTSAGIAGIIIGFAAQKALSTLLAGIQIAFTQPIRLDDVVIVEGEWGTIEEINLTYVVVKIWDKRRLVVPTTYFIEKPFQNWTRNSADILGTIFIYANYKISVDVLREAQTAILKTTTLWDGQVDIIQVTNATKDMIEMRSLVSAKDSPTAWDLRVYVREKLIDFLQKNYPDQIPYQHVRLEKLGEQV